MQPILEDDLMFSSSEMSYMMVYVLKRFNVLLKMHIP